MIRVLLAVAVTVCGVVLLLGYRAPGPPHDPLADGVAVIEPRTEGRAGHRCSATGGAKVHVTGPPGTWPFGHVRVRVALAGCRIVDVSVANLVTTNPVSQRRSGGAVRLLRGEVLSRQCADVDVVSGATYTSKAYLRSLQAVLDAAHAGRRCR